jgi:hypothetical protein
MTFHVLNGESTAEVFKRTDIPGKYISWREDLSAGRATDNGARNRESWIQLRAEALANAYQLDPRECHDELTGQDDMLETSLASDEIVLWFEYDMFCQVNLVYLLDWYERHADQLPRLTVPSIVPLLERGLGTLNASELQDLYANRTPVSEELRRLGQQIWRAYSNSDPSGLVDLMNIDVDELAHLGRSLRCHLSRFPSVENGLNRVENFGLGIISSGKVSFGELFREFWKSEGAYGFGDSQFFNEVKRLAECHTPLISAKLPDGNESGDTAFIKTVFDITEAGRDVLEHRADQVDLNGIDFYLGGAHLTTDSCWRWDSNDQTLRLR